MTHTFMLAKRPARLRAPLLVLLTLAFGACDSADRLSNSTVEDPTLPAAATPAPTDESDTSLALADTLGATDLSDPTGGMAISDDDSSPIDDTEQDLGGAEVLDADGAALAAESSGLSLSAFRGGVPFGTFHLPKTLYGRVFNGSLGNISRGELMGYLAQARRTGTRVLLTFSGNEANFKNSNKSFSFAKWKSRVARYKGLNLSSYIKDGTIIGHYLMDEPHDPANWGGRLVSRAQVDAMAKYSKQLWPSLPTVVRSWPSYLKGYRYRYLDAAWAQYSARKGAIGSFMSSNVADAKRASLKLVVGFNLLDGGNKASKIRGNLGGKYAISASQLRQWGAVILNNSYACAFLSWKYSAKYLNRSDIRSAMSYLASKARSNHAGSCRAR